MKLPGIAIAAAAGWFGLVTHASAQPDAPVDYTRRNEALAPAVPPSTPSIRQPATERRLDDPPRAFAVSSPGPGPLAARKAPIDVAETRPKSIAPVDATRPDAAPPAMSRLDHQLARVSTAADAVKPPLVQKYQAALSPGGAVQVGHLPALAPGASAAINRFVFRHNRPVPAPGPATPAGMPDGVPR